MFAGHSPHRADTHANPSRGAVASSRPPVPRHAYPSCWLGRSRRCAPWPRGRGRSTRWICMAIRKASYLRVPVRSGGIGSQPNWVFLSVAPWRREGKNPPGLPLLTLPRRRGGQTSSRAGMPRPRFRHAARLVGRGPGEGEPRPYGLVCAALLGWAQYQDRFLPNSRGRKAPGVAGSRGRTVLLHRSKKNGGQNRPPSW